MNNNRKASKFSFLLMDLNNNNNIIISTIFIQDSLFSKDITAITKGPVKIKVCKVKEKRSK